MDSRIGLAILTVLLLIGLAYGVDTTPPVGKIDINKESKFVTSRYVTLTINANDEIGINRMCVSESETCTAWRAYEKDIVWTLSEGNGVKTIHVYIVDHAGNISHATDYIRLEEQ